MAGYRADLGADRCGLRPGAVRRRARRRPRRRGSTATGPTATTPSSATTASGSTSTIAACSTPAPLRAHHLAPVLRPAGRVPRRQRGARRPRRDLRAPRRARTRLRPFVFGLMPNETWRYDRADGDLLFHFSAGYDDAGGGDLYDYRLVESVLDLRGAADAPIDQLLLSRADPLAGLRPHAQLGAQRSRTAEGHERAIGRVSIDYGTTTDSYELQFARRLTATANLIAVGEGMACRSPTSCSASGYAETTRPRSPGSAIGSGCASWYSTGPSTPWRTPIPRMVFRLGRPLGPGQYLIGRVELPLPSGRWSWRAAIEQGEEAGVVLPRDTVRAAARAHARAERPGARRRGRRARVAAPKRRARAAHAVRPLPGAKRAQAVLRGRRRDPGRRVSARDRCVPDEGRAAVPDRRPAVTLSVRERAAGPVIRAYRTLQLGISKRGAT